MKFELLIKDCCYSFCCILSSEVLNDVDKTEIFLFSERWSVSEWKFVIENMIVIVKQIVDESNSNCKCINNVNTKMIFYY